MTQEELDALMQSDNIEEFETQQHEEDAIVNQLNSITVDSEKKATEIMGKLDQVLAEIDASETCIKDQQTEKSLLILEDIRKIVFDIMSVMQYQDIHRQKIERVMNTMVYISSLMSNTLNDVAPNIAPSAKHIDEADGEVISEEELAQLVAANMGNN